MRIKKCVIIGVLLLVSSPAILTRLVSAGEFGNIVGVAALERDSRIASIRAVEGLISVLNSVKSREIEGLEDPGEDYINTESPSFYLTQASVAFRDAFKILNSFDVPIFSINLDVLSEEEILIFRAMQERHGTKIANTRDLFGFFANRTEAMANQIDQMLEEPLDPILDRIVDEVSEYVIIGNLTAKLAKASFR